MSTEEYLAIIAITIGVAAAIHIYRTSTCRKDVSLLTLWTVFVVVGGAAYIVLEILIRI